MTGDDPDQNASEPLSGVSHGKISPAKAAALSRMLEQAGVNIPKLLGMYKLNSLEDMTEEQHIKVVTMVKKKESNGNNGKS